MSLLSINFRMKSSRAVDREWRDMLQNLTLKGKKFIISNIVNGYVSFRRIECL